MAVTGVFGADFSAFDKAIQTSTKNLEGLEAGAEKTNSSLRLMTQSQEQMLDKIGASGGKIQEVGAATEETSAHVNTLTNSYRQFDGMLQAAGINIGPQVKGLEDIANAAGKTTSELGLLGTAGLAAGAALTGWKIGQWIDEMTGASTIVENLARNFMGLEAAMTDAEVKQLTINKALEMGAPAAISFANAQKFIAEQTQRNADASINWRDRLADAHREVRNLTDAQKEGITIAQEGDATVTQITNKYGISALALSLLTEETDKATAAQAKLNAERQKELDATAARAKQNEVGIQQMETDARLMADRAAFDAQQEVLRVKRLETGAAYVKQMGELAAVNKSAADFDKNLATEQAALDVENQKLIGSYTQMEAAHLNAGAAAQAGGAQTVAAYAGVQQQVEITSDGVRGWLALMAATNRANAILNENSLFTTGSQLNRVADVLSGGGLGGTSGAFAPSFASGIENFGGGLAKVHGGEVLANLPAGTSVFPKGQVGGSNISNVFNLVDSESNLARRVADLIMRQVRAGTQLGTA
jgi:hypothetical protein